MGTGLRPADVPHYCRTCGAYFPNRGVGLKPHNALLMHRASAHSQRTAQQCHSNCSFKQTYFEAQEGRMIHGAAAAQGRARA